MLRSPIGALSMLVGVLLAAACATGAGGTTSTATNAADPPGVEGEITVFAAASLTEAFDALGEAFAAANPGATLRYNTAASSSLAAQILQGAPVDVFASADEVSMDSVVGGPGTRGEPQVFATNVLEILVAPGNPRGIADLQDLADPELLVVVADPRVPIGRYTAQVLDRAGVQVAPRSLEESVKGVVTKVTLGEADAGIVYRTDVLAAGSAGDGVAIPGGVNVVARYPIAVLSEAPNPAGAAAFSAFVRAAPGRAILEAHGFGVP